MVLEAFLDRPLDETLAWLRRAAPEITHIEVGAGGYAPHPHCDVAGLLASASARSAWLDGIARHGLGISALNAWGNPLHPDAGLARRHDEDLRNAIRLAAALGVTRVVAMAGCPAGEPGDRVPHFGAGGWLPYLEGVYERQWEQQIAPYSAGLATFAAAEHPGLRVCLELHPGTCVFNVETFARVASLGPAIGANLDPSHFFWMGMDGHRVAAALGGRVGHVHGKDTVFHPDSLALNGLLDRRWPEAAACRGRSPSPAGATTWPGGPGWCGRCRSRRPRWCRSSTRTRSSRPTGVPEAARLLARRSTPPGAWRGDGPAAAGRPGGHASTSPRSCTCTTWPSSATGSR